MWSAFPRQVRLCAAGCARRFNRGILSRQPAQQLESIEHDAAAHRLGGAADIRQAEHAELMDRCIIARHRDAGRSSREFWAGRAAGSLPAVARRPDGAQNAPPVPFAECPARPRSPAGCASAVPDQRCCRAPSRAGRRGYDPAPAGWRDRASHRCARPEKRCRRPAAGGRRRCRRISASLTSRQDASGAAESGLVAT